MKKLVNTIIGVEKSLLLKLVVNELKHLILLDQISHILVV